MVASQALVQLPRLPRLTSKASHPKLHLEVIGIAASQALAQLPPLLFRLQAVCHQELLQKVGWALPRLPSKPQAVSHPEPPLGLVQAVLGLLEARSEATAATATATATSTASRRSLEVLPVIRLRLPLSALLFALFLQSLDSSCKYSWYVLI